MGPRAGLPAARHAALAQVLRAPSPRHGPVCRARASRPSAVLLGALLLGGASGARITDKQCGALTDGADVVGESGRSLHRLLASETNADLEEHLWLLDGPGRMRPRRALARVFCCAPLIPSQAQ